MSAIPELKGTAVKQYLINGTIYGNTVCYIGDLADDPAISTAELKFEFDKSGFETQRYINEIIVPKINELDESSSNGVAPQAIQPYHFNEASISMINNIAENFASIKMNEEKLRAESTYIKNQKYAASQLLNDGSVGSDLLGSGSVTDAKIPNYSIGINKLSFNVPTTVQNSPMLSSVIFNSEAEYNASPYRNTNVVCYVKK